MMTMMMQPIQHAIFVFLLLHLNQRFFPYATEVKVIYYEKETNFLQMFNKNSFISGYKLAFLYDRVYFPSLTHFICPQMMDVAFDMVRLLKQKKKNRKISCTV